MKNREYWKKRFEQLEDAANKKALNVYSDIDIEFQIAQRQIENQINTWFQRFAINNQVTMAEARKMLRAKELAELKWDIKDYIKYGQENELNSLWMKQLENASAKFHISRLEALKLQTQNTIEVLYGNQLDSIDDFARSTYTDGYYKTIFEVQKGFNVGWGIASINNNVLDKIISKPWAADGKNFSERIWTNKTSLINELHTQLTQTCILGKAPDAAINAIADKFNVSRHRAGSLVMTESAYFSSMALKDSYENLGVGKYEIVATLDMKTSEICQSLDGKVFDMKDYEPGITANPFHVRCRTTTVPYFEDDFGERAARGADGKTYYVSSDMKYKEWKDEFVKDNPTAELNLKKEKNFNADVEQFEKYKQIMGKDFPETVEEFQEMKYNNSEKWGQHKADKQSVLNSKSFEEIKGLKGKLGNLETRLWYKAQDKKILNLIDKSLPLEQQAREAHSLRNTFRTQARDLMKDQEARRQLDLKHPELPFEYYVKKYSKPNQKGEIPTKDDIYRMIIQKSTTSNKTFDKKAGVKDES